MCGIAGYFGNDRPRVMGLFELMGRRGPDAFGIHEYGDNLIFAHSRLKIIDLGDEHNQPIQDDKYVMVFNGEIYNADDIKAELKRDQVKFKIEGDTETLFAALCNKGIEWTLANIEGMFAIAFYNRVEGKLYLIRDRFGEKPLFTYRNETGFYFGSEPKFIKALAGGALFDINYNQVLRYLTNGYRSLFKGGETFFTDLEQVEPGEYWDIDIDGGAKKNNYHTFSLVESCGFKRDHYVEGVRERLIDAVKLSTRSHVPIAFCMSSGVDSNSLVSIASKELGRKVAAFTIWNEDDRYNESELTVKSACELEVDLITIKADSHNFLSNMRSIIRYHESPLASISYYVHWLLMKEVNRAGFKVVLSGTGADELFGGYYDHWLYWLAYIQEHHLSINTLEIDGGWTEYIKPLVRNELFKNPFLFMVCPNYRSYLYNDYENTKYLLFDWAEEFTEEQYMTNSELRRRMLNELFYESIPPILFEDDLNSMFFSIENRSPFLNKELFDFSLTIPTECLFRDGYNKSILRESMRGIVPDCILDQRRKVGFNSSIKELWDDRDNEWLYHKGSPIYSYVNRGKVIDLFSKERFDGDENKFAFNFISTKIFLEEFS